MDPAAEAGAAFADGWEDISENNSEAGSEDSGAVGQTTAAGDSDVELASTSQQVRDQLEDMASKHKSKGDAAFERQEWDAAIKEFTSGLKCANGTRQEADLLVRRSNALIRFSRHLLSIPARLSERRAVYAHDPLVLGQLALKDATRAAKLRPQWAEVSACEGRALLLLEKHPEAEAAFLEGLALDPTHKTLKEELQGVQDILAQQEQDQQQLLADVRKASMEGGSSEAAAMAAAAAGSSAAAAATAAAVAGGSGSGSPVRRVRSISMEGGPAATAGLGPKRQRRVVSVADADDADCILCMKLLYAPVTTPCGHTFCKACFARSMDHCNRCPVCRTVLHVGRELPVSVTLQTIISKAFPEEYSSREQEMAAAAAAAVATTDGSNGSSRVSLPLFVMSTLVPGEKMALNIFEPRYRLMVRRCMEGNRRFGMAQTGRSGPDGLDEVAIEAEILECNPLPDGRYYLELVGRRRLKITQSWELDGYRVASAEVVRDDVINQPQQDDVNTASPTAAEASAAAGTAAAIDGGRGSIDAVDAGAVASGVLGVCDELMTKMRNMLASRRMAAGHIRELFDRLGDKPSPRDPEAVSWWASRLLLLLLPSNAEHWMRRELLAETDTLARLRRLQERLGAMAQAEVVGGQSCAIM